MLGVLGEEQRLKPTLLKSSTQLNWADALVGNKSQDTETHGRSHRRLTMLSQQDPSPRVTGSDPRWTEVVRQFRR
jgi:hypothetical protein